MKKVFLFIIILIGLIGCSIDSNLEPETKHSVARDSEVPTFQPNKS